MSKKYFCDKCGKETDKNELYHHAGYSKSYEDIGLKIDTFCSSAATSNYNSISEPKYYDLCPHRRKVYDKVNVYSIQTAGYDNMVVPEHAYRTSIFSGWNGNFLTFADMVNKQWDEVDSSFDNCHWE